MISAGQVAGTGPVPAGLTGSHDGVGASGGAPAGSAPQTYGQFGAGGINRSGPMDSMSEATQVSENALDRTWGTGENQANREMQYANWGFQIGGQLIGAVMQGYIATKDFAFRLGIADRMATRDETIAGYQKEVALKTLEQLPELQREKDDLARELNKQHEAGQTNRTRLALESQERIAAMRNLDSAFGLRSEYNNYGNPFAA